MRRPLRRAVLGRTLAAAIALAAVACGDDKRDPATRTVDNVFEDLYGDGLPSTDVAAYDGKDLDGGECKRGRINGVEVTACRYADDDKARKAKAAGLKAIGETTGSALVSGPVLLVVADRDGKDPSGKTIDAITKSFLQKPVSAPPAKP